MNYKPHALREKGAILHLNVGRTTFRKLVANGQLPQPYCLGGCRVWKTTELESAFDKLIGAANDNEPQLINSWADVIEGAKSDD